MRKVWDGDCASGGHVQTPFLPLSFTPSLSLLFSCQILEYSIPAGKLDSKGTTKGTQAIAFIFHHYFGKLLGIPELCLTAAKHIRRILPVRSC